MWRSLLIYVLLVVRPKKRRKHLARPDTRAVLFPDPVLRRQNPCAISLRWPPRFPRSWWRVSGSRCPAGSAKNIGTSGDAPRHAVRWDRARWDRHGHLTMLRPLPGQGSAPMPPESTTRERSSGTRRWLTSSIPTTRCDGTERGRSPTWAPSSTPPAPSHQPASPWPSTHRES